MITLHVISLFFFTSHPAFSKNLSPPKVLVLHSYHKSLSWVEDIEEGIIAEFGDKKPNTSLRFEYMDTKRINRPDYLQSLLQLYTIKFNNIHFDIIICSDNNALNFLLTYKHLLFPDTPIVFCGINNFKEEILADQDLVTGTIEEVDFKATIDIALKIHPETEQIIFYGDNSATYHQNIALLDKLIPIYGDRLQFQYKNNFSIEKISTDIQNLKANNLVLLGSTIRTESGDLLSFQESIKMMEEVSNTPIYGCWNFYLDHGLVGGMIISGVAQGKKAASIALQILNGEAVTDIPVTMKSPNRYMFDNNQLKKFNIDPSLLPNDAIIINRHLSFYAQNSKFIVLALGVVSSLSIVVMVLSFNIRSRRRAESKLKNQAMILDAIFNNAPNIMILVNQKSQVEKINHNGVNFSGKKEDTLIGLLGGDIFNCLNSFDGEGCGKNPECSKCPLRTRVESTLQTTNPHLEEEGEMTFLFNNERVTRNFLISTVLLRVNDDNKVLLTLTDVTNLKRTEQVLQEQTTLLNKSQEISHTGAWKLDVLKDELIWSDENYTIFELPQGTSLTYQTFHDCIHPDDKEYVNREWKAALKNKSYDIEHRLLVNGKVKSVREKAELIFNENNECIAATGFTMDITEIKKLLAGKKEAETERLKLQTQLQQAQKMEAIGTLAGGIAHDFNNILAAMLGYTEMAKDDSQPGSTVKKDLEKVLEAGNRARDLVQQILAFSRQDQTETMLLQPVNIVNEVIKMLRPSIPTTIEIIQNIQAKTGSIMADPTQIHQIVMNLCTNAFHAMEETGGKLEILLKEVTLCREDLIDEPDIKDGTFIQLSIYDSGPGIAPDIKEKIFEPYFTTKGIGKGTGMGLSIVHGIVKNYGGFISFYSEPGSGTAFNIFLPVIEKEPPADTKTAEPIPIGKERILFVDDEKILAEMGKDMLERLGYHVTVRNSSLEALETFQNEPDQFDIVITDQTMPGMTGADLSRRMLQIRPDISIILCTGYSTIISEEKAKSMGIKEFALKPLAKKDIAVLIRRVLDGK